jgi:diguanylate cyclase (GGDEF)-like protein
VGARITTPAEELDRALMVNALAGMFASGGTLALLTLTLPHAPVNETGVAVSAALGYPAAALLLLIRRRTVPMWFFHVMVALGTLVVTAGVYFGEGGAPSAAAAAFYLWSALYAFHFFPWKAALAHIGLIGVAYAGALVALDAGEEAPQQWLLLMGTTVVAGVVVGSLARQVRALARVDELTGLTNRRGWVELLSRELARARREGYEVCIALVDLDHFKELNDGNGHMAGDRVLRELATRWRQELRPADVLARYGGDEFAVMLPRCSVAQAEDVLERMRRAAGDGQTFSAGIVSWNRQDEPDTLLELSDEALYRAKRGGRNRTATV